MREPAKTAWSRRRCAAAGAVSRTDTAACSAAYDSEQVLGESQGITRSCDTGAERGASLWWQWKGAPNDECCGATSHLQQEERVIAPHDATLALLAVAVIVVACHEPVAPDRLDSSDRSTANAKKALPSGGPLQIKAEYKVEKVDAEHTREALELRAAFTGIDPLGEQGEVEHIQLNFEPIEIENASNTKSHVGASVESAAWEELDGGDFVFSAKDAQAVQEVVKVQVIESGQAVADLTGYVAAAEGRLTFNANLKRWDLTLELTGIITPSMIVTPSMLKTLAGSVVGGLVIDQTEITTRIRENEATFQSAQLVLNAETKLVDAGQGQIFEAVDVFIRFASSELQPNPAIPLVEDLTLDFEINYAGVVGPPCLRLSIPAGTWIPGDGGGFKVGQSSDIKYQVVLNGQVVLDLTDQLAVEGSLRHNVNTKSWELRLEIAGVVIPSDIHAPILAPIAGARLAALQVGAGLEHFSAMLLRNEAIF